MTVQPQQYIITEEDICTIRDYILGAFYEGENKEKMYDLIKGAFSVVRSHPYQSERELLDELEKIIEQKDNEKTGNISFDDGRWSAFTFVKKRIAELRRQGEQE